jgi:transcriptional regulator with XRE-family HTH domain
MTLGERIKSGRQKLGFSQEKIAELVGTSRQAVTKWESDKSIPSMKNLMTLAEIFGVPLTELSSGADEAGYTENAPNETEETHPRKRLLLPDAIFVLVLLFAAWSIIKIPALIGYSVVGFLTIVAEAAAILYVPLYLLWIRPRCKRKTAVKTKAVASNRAARAISSVLVLFLCFLLCRFAFFGLHGNKDWPMLLLVVGLAVVIVAALLDMRKLMTFTVVGYIGSFALGIIFNVEGVDPGGGTTNNWWVIWTASFAAMIFVGAAWDVVRRRMRNTRMS